MFQWFCCGTTLVFAIFDGLVTFPSSVTFRFFIGMFHFSLDKKKQWLERLAKSCCLLPCFTTSLRDGIQNNWCGHGIVNLMPSDKWAGGWKPYTTEKTQQNCRWQFLQCSLPGFRCWTVVWLWFLKSSYDSVLLLSWWRQPCPVGILSVELLLGGSRRGVLGQLHKGLRWWNYDWSTQPEPIRGKDSVSGKSLAGYLCRCIGPSNVKIYLRLVAVGSWTANESEGVSTTLK